VSNIAKFKSLEKQLININGKLVLIASDAAKLYGVETRDINKAVKNNPDKFPSGHIVQLNRKQKKDVVENFHHLSNLKYSPHLPKAFTEKGLYMLATIIKSEVATDATIQIIETFAKFRELNKNINAIINTNDEKEQKSLAQKSNEIFEDIMDIVFEEDKNSNNVIEEETRVELNLGIYKRTKTTKRKK
jgi:hypothetical protein